LYHATLTAAHELVNAAPAGGVGIGEEENHLAALGKRPTGPEAATASGVVFPFWSRCGTAPLFLQLSFSVGQGWRVLPLLPKCKAKGNHRYNYKSDGGRLNCDSRLV
jgi:hypothetical protein